jgi:hypothetical protein
MNTRIVSAVALAVAALSAGQAMAADTSSPKTREQVNAEYADAVRSGNIVASGQTGLKLNELNPSLYPAARPVAQGLSREQVKADLAEASRAGDIFASGEAGGGKLNELHPNQYPAHSVVQSPSRALVKAELAEALRSGDIIASGEAGGRKNELYPNRYRANAVN